MQKDNLITYGIIGAAVLGLLFLTLSSTGQFTGKNDQAFWSAIDKHTFNSHSDFDGDGVLDYEECPNLKNLKLPSSTLGDNNDKVGGPNKLLGKAGFGGSIGGGIGGGGGDDPMSDIDCVMSEWSDWSECEYKYEDDSDGIQYRTRTIITNAIGRGEACPTDKETRWCTKDPEYEGDETPEETPEETLEPSEKVGQVLGMGCPDFNNDGVPDWADPKYPPILPSEPEPTPEPTPEEPPASPALPEGIEWAAPLAFSADQCKVTMNNGLYEGDALIIIQISSGSDIKKYSFESIYLTALQQLVIETTSPDDWDSSYDCEIFVWKDFSGEPIDSNANWKYTPITVGTPPQTPPAGSGDLTGGTDDLTLGGGGVSLG